MKQVKAKIYYEITTGTVLTITSECEGVVEETTKEQDMNIYNNLKGKNINDVDYIELEYGTLGATFNNVKSYEVNAVTKKLERAYYTQAEIDEMTNNTISPQEQLEIDNANLLIELVQKDILISQLQGGV